MIITAQQIIETLNLIKHPEGGWFKEVYRSVEFIQKEALPVRYNGNRNFGTSIYFLLESHEFSAFHRIKSDELWHFYSGSPVTIYILQPEGTLQEITLGKGLNYQCTIPANCWFAAEVIEQNSYCLVGCTVNPGFNFEDFELAEKKKLTEEFPQHSSIINHLTR